MGRGKGDGSGCSKILLVILNGFFMLLGLAVLALGIYLKVDPSYSAISNVFNQNFANQTSSNGGYLIDLQSTSIVIIIIGAVISAISIIGIIGACCEAKFLLIIYGIIITLLLLGLLAIGIAALVFKYALRNSFENEFKNVLLKDIQTLYQGQVGSPNAFTFATDIFQIYFQCCGVNNYSDFVNATSWNNTAPGSSGALVKIIAPIACCKFSQSQRDLVLKGGFPKLDDYTCAITPTNDNSNFNIGCLTPMNSYLDTILLVVLIVTIVVGLILIMGSVASCCMCRSI